MRKSIFVIPLVALVLTGCTSGGGRRRGGGGGGGSEGGGGDIPEDWEYYRERYTNKKDCYGNDVSDYLLYRKRGEELLKQIHYYCVDQHKTYLVYKSDNTYDGLFPHTDRDPATGQMVYFYTGRVTSSFSNRNREHVWPCANSDDLWYRGSTQYEHQIDNNSHDYWGGGSDIYNLHICNATVNSKRGDDPFAILTNAEKSGAQEVGDGGPYKIIVSTRGKVEPPLQYRGDIARIAMYMWAHYQLIGDRNAYYPKDYNTHTPVYNIGDAVSEAGHTPYMFSKTLSLKKIIGYNTDEEVYRTLMEWNEQDPVSETEKYANDYIEQNVQGNRNPFVDYPDLVNRILKYL